MVTWCIGIFNGDGREEGGGWRGLFVIALFPRMRGSFKRLGTRLVFVSTIAGERGHDSVETTIKEIKGGVTL